MEFIIGNGLMFEEKDVIVAIQKLDFESKVTIVHEIWKDLHGMIEKSKSGLANMNDLKMGKLAMLALKDIRGIANSVPGCGGCYESMDTVD